MDLIQDGAGFEEERKDPDRASVWRSVESVEEGGVAVREHV